MKLTALLFMGRFISVFTKVSHLAVSRVSLIKFTPHTPCLYKNRLTIILSSMTSSSYWSLPFRFKDEHFYVLIISLMCVTCLAHIIIFDLITATILGEECKL